MIELTAARKNKVVLSDYSSEQDIRNRVLLSDCTSFELEVLEEILFSPLKISIKKLASTVDCDEEKLTKTLEKLSLTGLLALNQDFILVDKDLRKYFEFQITRFDSSFKPDMEFLSQLLRKVPIHLLPSWYCIPRTSNNIFESIVEKYLLTPHIYQRYLAELNLADPVILPIASDLFQSADLKLYSSDVIAKYNLERARFDEIMLLFEFNFIGCVSYERADDHWIETITPFHEWKEYLRFIKSTEAAAITDTSKIQKTQNKDFAFIEDMERIIASCVKKPLSIGTWQPGADLPAKVATDLAGICQMEGKSEELSSSTQAYLKSLLNKILLIELCDISSSKLIPQDGAQAWLMLSKENQSLHIYRHPKNRILNPQIPAHIASERNVREAEKSIKRVLRSGWVYFEDFFQGLTIPLSEHSVIELRKTGKNWKYTLPVYSEEEKMLVKSTIFEWLFETGMIATGTLEGRDCFTLTAFGRFFFDE